MLIYSKLVSVYIFNLNSLLLDRKGKEGSRIPHTAFINYTKQFCLFV